MVVNIEQNTKLAARTTKVERQVEKKKKTRHRLIETGKQTRKVREGDQGYYW